MGCAKHKHKAGDGPPGSSAAAIAATSSTTPPPPCLPVGVPKSCPWSRHQLPPGLCRLGRSPSKLPSKQG
eukprot:1160362-Pelagomonas_calceolata.AAC.2